MRQILFELDIPGLGTVAVPGYTFFIMIGAVLCILLVRHDSNRSPVLREDAVDFGFIALPMFLIGGRIGYLLSADLTLTLSDPLRAFEYWKGGLVFYGGAVGIGIAAVTYCKLKGLRFSQLGDVWARGTAFGMVFARTGCLMAGCCWGAPIDHPWGIEWPWAITFWNSSTVPEQLLGVALHPTQIYSMITWLIIGILLTFLRRVQTFDGQLYAVLIMAYAPLRFLVETHRGDDIRGLWFDGLLSSSQIMALPIFGVGLGLYRYWRGVAEREGTVGLTVPEAMRLRDLSAGRRLAHQA